MGTMAMHPSRRTGVRFVLANPSDPSRLNELTDWYDTYSAAITVPGYLANDVHFENPGASTGRPRSCRRACSTAPHDSGSSKDPPSPPDGSRSSRPTTPTPSTPTSERPATRRPHHRSSPS